MKIRRLAVVAVMASCVISSAEAAWIYTETNTVANGVSQGSLTDGVWTFYATRAKNSATDLSVDANKGMSVTTEDPVPIDFTVVRSEDNTVSYKVVAFTGIKGATSLRSLPTEFVAPDCSSFGGENCFYSNVNLTNVYLRQDVAITLNSDRMFYKCTNLRSFSPRKIGVTLLRIDMFSGCSGLDGGFELPDCTQINGSAFADCSALGEIKAPNVITLTQYAFSGCSSLSNVVLSSAIQNIGNYAFKGCSKISTEFVQSLLHKDLNRLGNSVTDRKGCFMECTGLTGTLVWNLPNMVTNVVPQDCFNGCTSLQRVEFKSNVVEICVGAFYNIASDAEIYMPSEPVSVYGSDAVANKAAPYPKVYLKNDDNLNRWLDVIYADSSHSLILKEEFNDSSWVSENRSDVGLSKIHAWMVKDTTMCQKADGVLTVNDKSVIGFVMKNTNSGCWILRAPKTGFNVILR